MREVSGADERERRCGAPVAGTSARRRPARRPQKEAGLPPCGAPTLRLAPCGLGVSPLRVVTGHRDRGSPEPRAGLAGGEHTYRPRGRGWRSRRAGRRRPLGGGGAVPGLGRGASAPDLDPGRAQARSGRPVLSRPSPGPCPALGPGVHGQGWDSRRPSRVFWGLWASSCPPPPSGAGVTRGLWRRPSPVRGVRGQPLCRASR